MKFPSWNEFQEKWTKTENEVKNKIQEFKDEHQILNKSIKYSLTFLPHPFNYIANNIYDNFLGNYEQKASNVLKYFNDIQKQGKEHYEEIILRLEEIVGNIEDVKVITAKQNTLLKIQEAL